MQLRTFRAPDLATALAKARRELGPHALVLATNEIRGRLGLTSIEITVGVDRPVAHGTEQELQRIAREVERLRGKLDAVDSPRPATDARPAAVAHPATTIDPVLRRTVDTLVRSGLSADLAERFARIASRELPRKGGLQELAGATERGIAALLDFRPAPLSANVLFVVGPPGSGKTTTVAKLAAREALGAGRSVIFAETDTERVGSLEQADIYSKHIGARLARVDDPADLGHLVEETADGGALFVDTAGVGTTDGARLRELVELRESAPGAEVALLIPSGLHAEEARGVIERFAPLEPTCAAFSRVDDARRLGDLVTALAPTRIPLAFVTNGHRVPDDLEDASPRGLAAMMLRFADGAGRSREMHR